MAARAKFSRPAHVDKQKKRAYTMFIFPDDGEHVRRNGSFRERTPWAESERRNHLRDTILRQEAAHARYGMTKRFSDKQGGTADADFSIRPGAGADAFFYPSKARFVPDTIHMQQEEETS